jgi:hypothetical protein
MWAKMMDRDTRNGMDKPALRPGDHSETEACTLIDKSTWNLMDAVRTGRIAPVFPHWVLMRCVFAIIFTDNKKSRLPAVVHLNNLANEVDNLMVDLHELASPVRAKQGALQKWPLLQSFSLQRLRAIWGARRPCSTESLQRPSEGGLWWCFLLSVFHCLPRRHERREENAMSV